MEQNLPQQHRHGSRGCQAAFPAQLLPCCCHAGIQGTGQGREGQGRERQGTEGQGREGQDREGQGREGQDGEGQDTVRQDSPHSALQPPGVPGSVPFGVMINPGRAGALAAIKGWVLLCSLGTASSLRAGGDIPSPSEVGWHCPGISWPCWRVCRSIQSTWRGGRGALPAKPPEEGGREGRDHGLAWTGESAELQGQETALKGMMNATGCQPPPLPHRSALNTSPEPQQEQTCSVRDLGRYEQHSLAPET